MERLLATRIRQRLSESSPLIQVIIGPRQVGKTTALKMALGGRGIYETADYPTPLGFEVVEEWWLKAERSQDRILAIDEIQKISGWSEMVKLLWDRSEGKMRFLVTDSSALLLEKGLKETLAGRYELLHADHWNYREAKEIFGLSLAKYIEFGCYPGSNMFLHDVERWGAYVRDSIVEPAIGRDLLQLHPVDQPALLRQLFGLAVTLPAQRVSLKKLQGELQGKGTLPTLQNYLRLLGDAFLVSGIDKYSKSGFRQRKSSPKIIIHDNALLKAFERPITGPLDPDKLGRYFENTVGARFIEAGWQTFYWKDRDHEVDFVVLGPGGEKWAIEVKLSSPSESELKGLREFTKLYPDFKACLLCLNVKDKYDGITLLDPIDILSLQRV